MDDIKLTREQLLKIAAIKKDFYKFDLLLKKARADG
nr:MAG TPA: hypothetical protein [Caudoviricetes sp.]